jgi:hypothetical protein
MTEPTLTCPTCRTQIKLTESLAAPLIEDTRRRYEDQLARKEAEVAGREATIRDQQAQIAVTKDAIDAQVAAKVEEERGRIVAAEAQKAKRLVATDVDAKVKEIADLNDVLRQRDAKLAKACTGMPSMARAAKPPLSTWRRVEPIRAHAATGFAINSIRTTPCDLVVHQPRRPYFSPELETEEVLL